MATSVEKEICSSLPVCATLFPNKRNGAQKSKNKCLIDIVNTVKVDVIVL